MSVMDNIGALAILGGDRVLDGVEMVVVKLDIESDSALLINWCKLQILLKPNKPPPPVGSRCDAARKYAGVMRAEKDTL